MSDNAPRVPSGWSLERSVSGWQRLRAQYANDPALADDEDVILAALADAEVTHPEVLLERAIDAAVWCDMREVEADDLRRAMVARRDRYKARADMIRAMVLELLGVLERKSHRAKLGMGIVSMTRPAVVIIDAQQVPNEFVTIETIRTPDKLAIRAAIEGGEVVPGAVMSNAAPSLQIRRAR